MFISSFAINASLVVLIGFCTTACVRCPINHPESRKVQIDSVYRLSENRERAFVSLFMQDPRDAVFSPIHDGMLPYRIEFYDENGQLIDAELSAETTSFVHHLFLLRGRHEKDPLVAESSYSFSIPIKNHDAHHSMRIFLHVPVMSLAQFKQLDTDKVALIVDAFWRNRQTIESRWVQTMKTIP